MRKKIAISLSILGMGVLLTQFTNCSNFADNSLSQAELSSVLCTGGLGTVCIEADPSLLEIQSKNTSIGVEAGQNYVLLSGDCNEAAYTSNNGLTHKIEWRVVLGSTTVHQGESVNACEAGRFLIKVDVPVGLYVSSTRSAHQVMYNIVGLRDGQMEPNEPIYGVPVGLIPVN